MKKISMVALLIVIISVGLFIFFNGEIGESTEEAKISTIGGFSADNVDFSFSILSALDAEEDNIIYIDLTHDIRKSLTTSLMRQHAEKNPSPEHPTSFIGSLMFTDNDGFFRKIQFYKDESDRTYINFPLSFENYDKYYALTTDHFPDLFLQLRESQ
ncbi:hypothetical protein NYE67_15935 [Solibacillus sp. FSL W8-0474]|uniref:hypothetical protein n=1 Tax=Solibacillus sp. FSL W8-0474 TaxID=2975336 RepID=UPI0030F7F9A2